MGRRIVLLEYKVDTVSLWSCVLIAACPPSPLLQKQVQALQEMDIVYDAQEKMYMTEQLGQVHASLRALNLAENIRSDAFNPAEVARIREDEKNMADAEHDRAVGKGREHNISIHETELLNKRSTLEEQLVCSAI